MMNILEYINELVENGYNEEDAEICADYLFSEDPDYSDRGGDFIE